MVGIARFGRVLRGLLLLIALLACAAGCAWGRQNPFAETATCQLPPESPEAEVVRVINERARRVGGWRAMNAKLTYNGPEGSHTLNAEMAIQAPRNFLLDGKSIVGSEVQIGSNADRFWFWAKRSQHHHVLTACHEDLCVAQRRFPVPFQPDWLMEALGVTELDGTGMRVEECPLQKGQRARRLWLVCDRVSPQGEPVKKVVLVDACHGLPLKHELIDSQNRRIATASLMNWRPDRESGEPVPGVIALEWPAAKMSITISLGEVDVNPSIPESAWAMPEYPQYPVMDLGKVADADDARPHHRTAIAE